MRQVAAAGAVRALPDSAKVLDRRAVLFLVALYTAAHGWLFLIADAWYWDDWVLRQAPPADLIALFWQSGLPWFGYGHVALLEYGAPLYRLIIFAVHLLAGCCVYGIFASLKHFSRDDRLVIAGLFLVLPLFSARVSLVTIWYSVGAGLFFLAWYLWVRFEQGGRPTLRLLVPVLFFVSFSVQSLLVFYALPVAHVWYLRRAWSLRTAFDFIRQHLDLFAAPFVFWLLKLAFVRPHGMFEGYLTIDPKARFLLNTPMYVAYEFLALRVDPVVVGACFALLWWLSTRSPGGGDAQRPGVAAAWLTLGLVVAYVALLPYLLVGKIPSFSDWGSRHQLLMALGSAVAIVAAGKLLPGASGRAWVCGWLALSLAVTVGNYLDYHRDWTKQQALMRAFAAAGEIRDGTTFPVSDRARAYNANGRVYRLYEYAGFLNVAFGDDQRRYADNLRRESLQAWRARRVEESEKFRARFGLANYVPGEPDCLIVIERGAVALTGVNLARAIYYRVARPDAYHRYLDDLLSVSCQPLPRAADR